MIVRLKKYTILSLVIAATLFIPLLSGCADIQAPANTAAQNQQAAADHPSVYFPRSGQDPTPVLTSLYAGAKTDIDVAVFNLSHPDIVKAIIQAHKRGIKVRVITDQGEIKGSVQKQTVNRLVGSGIEVKVNTHPGLMHLKMSIVDNLTVATGSCNYTKSASEKNDEMLVLLRDPAFAEACQREFNRMWNESCFQAVNVN